jgi:flagellar protein FlaG
MEVVTLAISTITNAAVDYSDVNKVDTTSKAAVQAINTVTSTSTRDGYDVTSTELSKNSTGDDRQSEANAKRIKSLVDGTNNIIKEARRRCEYSYHDEVNRVSIKVINSETQEVIKEIPPEESFKTLQKIWEAAGILVDEKR